MNKIMQERVMGIRMKMQVSSIHAIIALVRKNEGYEANLFIILSAVGSTDAPREYGSLQRWLGCPKTRASVAHITCRTQAVCAKQASPYTPHSDATAMDR